MQGLGQEPVVPLAHSADEKRGISPQTYADHIEGVMSRTIRAAEQAGCYARYDCDLLRKIVCLAAEYHDLGKLDAANQNVLRGVQKGRTLPIQHTEVGTVNLLDKLNIVQSATLVRSHHIGLPDFVEESNRPASEVLRDADANIREHVNQTLDDLLCTHGETRRHLVLDGETKILGNPALFFRLALSCLVDGDHTDTSVHHRNYTEGEPGELRPLERLKTLDKYVATLGGDDDRSKLRREVYDACKNAKMLDNITSCDSPVGTGKTTAIMAHLLGQAAQRKLRRIIVVLPFTNIIQQSVKVYRKALVLPGEDPTTVVAELHHRADYEDINSRQFSALWNAPIIVTTAVAFFETLASNKPSMLRRLHNLPGSAVFLDESHAALPAKLLPLAWHWIKLLASEWGCYWVLASGSLNRFWKIEEFDKEKPDLSEIMHDDLQRRLKCYERSRVVYSLHKERMSADKLTEWVATLPGPRIVILNTVQSAAVIANIYSEKFGRSHVEHLSTALAPRDRDTILEKVKTRLGNANDTNWVLIATSCVEAGVELSFTTGVREAASLTSLLQLAGRVNRDGKRHGAHVWTICLMDGGLLKKHPGMQDASQVLLEFFERGMAITPDLCTEALKREVRLAGQFKKSIMDKEAQMRFPEVEKDFRVITGDTRIVIVDPEVADSLENYERVNWKNVHRASVQIWGYRLDKLRVPEITGHPGMYKWEYGYDCFLGYMKGLLQMEDFFRNGAIV